VGKDVACRDNGWSASLALERFGKIGSEEAVPNIESFLSRKSNDIFRRVDADGLDTELPQRLEQHAVVAPDFDDEAAPGRKQAIMNDTG
jgi:hypothetical protein